MRVFTIESNNLFFNRQIMFHLLSLVKAIGLVYTSNTYIQICLVLNISFTLYYIFKYNFLHGITQLKKYLKYK